VLIKVTKEKKIY